MSTCTIPMDNLSDIAVDTLLMVIARDDWDEDEGTYPVPVTAWHSTEHLTNRNFIAVKSDTHGTPELLSEHNSIQTGSVHFWEQNTVDAIDWQGYWRTTEAAINFALYGTDGQYILGDGTDVRDMGQWSDGTPINPKQVVSDRTLDDLYRSL